jgi:lactate dehydrogenase-like 2-hydroxyacid dehydrogenase
MPNVMLTPQIGSAVAEKGEIMTNEIVNEIIAFVQEEAISAIQS